VPYAADYAESRFRHVDKDGRRYQEQNLSSPNPRPNLTYPYKASNGITYQPHKNGWKCDPERMKQLDEEGRLHFPKDPTGRLRLKMYLDESEGVAVQDVWTDILLPASSNERIGYPTQKPLALLERIIRASSNEGDLVLDPFCGCGTTVEAAERLRRKWIGIDVAIRAIDVIKDRLDEKFQPRVWKEFGEPSDADAAAHLAATNAYDFQWWAVRRIGGQPPRGEKKKGGDGGVDGEMFVRDETGKQRRVIISVKGGNLTPDFVRALATTVEHEKADYGILLTMFEPTRGMRDVARECGSVRVGDVKEPKIRIVTVPELFARTARLPAGKNETPRSRSSPPPAEARPGENLSFAFPVVPPRKRALVDRTPKRPPSKTPTVPPPPVPVPVPAAAESKPARRRRKA
jgi:site-specific DNA-methyltransferase (adenine-specific)